MRTTRTLPESAIYIMSKEAVLDDRERTKCEVWSRVMGYHRPTTGWNPGKQSEFHDRRLYKEALCHLEEQ